MIKRSVAEEKADLMILAQIIVQRQSGLLTDSEALAAPRAFERWGPNRKYGEGQIILGADGDDTLYRIAQSGGVEQSQAHQPPGGAGMLAVYRPIVLSAAGTKEDPIPWVYGMDCRTGLYYAHNGVTYLCKADMIPCVWTPGTVGLWQWEVMA